MSDKVDIREFREKLARETGGRGVDSKNMENFEKYRKAKYGKSSGQRDNFSDMKSQFGEMKINQIAARRKSGS